MRSIKVPLIRKHQNKATGNYENHIEHYKKDNVRNMPIKKDDGTFGNKQIKVLAGQVRMRHAKTFNEIKAYYGSAINTVISNIENKLESKYFDDSIANAFKYSNSTKENHISYQNKNTKTHIKEK